jgi:hypothetical protein
LPPCGEGNADTLTAATLIKVTRGNIALAPDGFKLVLSFSSNTVNQARE